MKVELTPEIAQWVEVEVAAGTFLTPEDAVERATCASSWKSGQSPRQRGKCHASSI